MTATTATRIASIPFASLPALGAALDGGTFGGITTQKNGNHCAVVLLPAKGEELTWKKAIAWAKEQGGELPTRPIAALLFANAKDKLQPSWHWTNEEYQGDASFAWSCSFHDGFQLNDHKSYVGSAVAVRCIPITA